MKLPVSSLRSALLLVLELPNVPVLRRLDARTYAQRVGNDPDLPPEHDQNGRPDGT